MDLRGTRGQLPPSDDQSKRKYTTSYLALSYKGHCNEKVNFERITGFAEWLYRPYGTRNRKFSLYIGGDIFFGYERMDLFNQASATCRQSLYNIGYSKYKIIYGLSPRIEGELFVGQQWAILFPIRIPITFNSQVGVFGFEVGVGARYNF